MCLASGVADNTFCERVRGGETVYGGWAVAAGPLTAGALAAAGLDYVVIDLQHGGATEHDLPGMTAAIRLAGATPIGRVRHAHPADMAAAVAGACRYPPAGYRSAGGVMARQPHPLCIVMVESSQAMADLPATLKL